MKFRRRSSVLPRAPWPNGLERTEPLRGQLWTRSERALREPDVHWARKVIAAAAAGIEIALLVYLWFGPALTLHNVQVIGARHMTSSQIAHAAGLSGDGSVISVDGEMAKQHLLNQVWIRSAKVMPQLPGTVLVQVSEWEPVASYHAGPSTKLYLLSSQAIVLGTTTSSATLRDKLTALKALARDVNYSSPDLDYVNVMNPVEPAVGFKSRPASAASPAPNPCK